MKTQYKVNQQMIEDPRLYGKVNELAGLIATILGEILVKLLVRALFPKLSNALEEYRFVEQQKKPIVRQFHKASISLIDQFFHRYNNSIYFKAIIDFSAGKKKHALHGQARELMI